MSLSKKFNVTINYGERKYRFRNCIDQALSFCAHVCAIIRFFLGKLFDLRKNGDIEAVLDILYQSNADFSEDDDADEIWKTLNVNTEAESSDNSISSEDLFAFPNDQLSSGRAIKLHRTTNNVKTTID